MARDRALWRATGMTNDDVGKPIVVVANSFAQFVPGHVHLRDVGRIVAASVAAAGGVGREFNTIAVDGDTLLTSVATVASGSLLDQGGR